MAKATAGEIAAALAAYEIRFFCTEPQPLVTASKDRPPVVYATLVVGKHEFVRQFYHADRTTMREELERVAFNELFGARA